jgi:peptidoglycan L-alanyl-D-glutamate endopeptidase CwlK
MASRKLEYLHPLLLPKCEAFLEEAKRVGVDVLITCTYRSDAEQNMLYAQGRTTPGAIVTRARGGKSAHNFVDSEGRPAAKAFDVVPLVNGKPIWDGKHPAWQTLGKIGMDLGLNWYGASGSKFHELPHFQLKE